MGFETDEEAHHPRRVQDGIDDEGYLRRSGQSIRFEVHERRS
jgi:hypothetical protein